MKYCSKCGTEIKDPSLKFCGNCGAAIAPSTKATTNWFPIVLIVAGVALLVFTCFQWWNEITWTALMKYQRSLPSYQQGGDDFIARSARSGFLMIGMAMFCITLMMGIVSSHLASFMVRSKKLPTGHLVTILFELLVIGLFAFAGASGLSELYGVDSYGRGQPISYLVKYSILPLILTIISNAILVYGIKLHYRSKAQ